MGIISVVMGKAKNLTLCDWVMLKIDLILVGMVIGAYAVGFVKMYLWYLVGLWVILEGALVYKLFLKK